MRRVSVDRVMRWKLCPRYTKARVKKLWKGRYYLSEDDIVGLPIPIEDRFIALEHLLTRQQRGVLARRIALDVIHLWDATDVIISFLKTGDKKLQAAAWVSSWDVIWDARDTFLVAIWATRAAGRAAAFGATLYTERSVVFEVAKAATLAITLDAERATGNDHQIAIWADAWEKYLSWELEMVREK